LTTRDAVDRETPAAAATSSSVGAALRVTWVVRGSSIVMDTPFGRIGPGRSFRVSPV
jgi:hypothetical protein